MKYENFEKAKSLVQKIDQTKTLIDDLSASNVFVSVQRSSIGIMTIGSWNSCEHEDKDLAAEFINKLSLKYQDKLERLKTELELC